MSYKMDLFYGIKDSIEQYKFEEAKTKLESFLSVHQGDLFALFEYAKLIIFDGDKGIEEAEVIFKKIIKDTNFNIAFGDLSRKRKNEKIRNETILELIYLNIEKNDYNEAYNNLMILDESKDFSYIDNGLRISILNKKEITNKESLTYLEKQQIGYSSFNSNSHIEKYHQDLNIKQKTMKFSEDINIKTLMSIVKPFLRKESRMHINNLYDSYLFKSNKIGNYDENKCNSNFFIVKTIKGTDNIVSMFPLKEASHVNLNEADNVIDINDIDLALQKLKKNRII